MMHLSRLAEDLILYASTEFGFIELSDAVSTGSSLMPQKKNPDALELIRGKAGRIFGHQTALLSMMKGLPLAYNKDMQEDKEAVFDTVDTVKICLQIAAIVLENLRVNEEKTREAAAKGFLNATELADYLVKKGAAFRTAHDTVGRIVLFAIEKNKELDELSLEEFREFSAEIRSGRFRRAFARSDSRQQIEHRRNRARTRRTSARRIKKRVGTGFLRFIQKRNFTSKVRNRARQQIC